MFTASEKREFGREFALGMAETLIQLVKANTSPEDLARRVAALANKTVNMIPRAVRGPLQVSRHPFQATEGEDER